MFLHNLGCRYSAFLVAARPNPTSPTPECQGSRQTNSAHNRSAQSLCFYWALCNSCSESAKAFLPLRTLWTLRRSAELCERPALSPVQNPAGRPMHPKSATQPKAILPGSVIWLQACARGPTISCTAGSNEGSPVGPDRRSRRGRLRRTSR